MTACGNLLGSLPDSGFDAGEILGNDAGADAGPDASLLDGGDAGDTRVLPDAGTDAGRFDAGYVGDGGPFGGSVMLLDSNYRRVASVSGFARDDVYALTTVTSSSVNVLLHYDGNAQEEWAPILSTPSSAIVAVKALPGSGAVAIVSEFQLQYCRGHCTDGGAYETDYAPQTLFRYACASENEAFALGEENSSIDAVLWRSGPRGQWRRYAGLPSMPQIFGCAVTADGTVFVAGEGEVGMVFSDGGTRVDPLQTDNWPYSTSAWFRALAPVGNTLLLTSSWSAVERLPSGAASRVFTSDIPGEVYALGYAHPDEVFAVGFSDVNSQILRRYRGTWSVESSWENRVDWYDIWFANQDEFFAVGQKKNSIGGIVGGIIFHGRR